jgi:hypothetical protein
MVRHGVIKVKEIYKSERNCKSEQNHFIFGECACLVWCCLTAGTCPSKTKASYCDRVAICTAQVGSCSPWDFLHQGGFLRHSIFSAWVWLPGDAWQFAREPVSCNSSVCMGLPIKGPMFDRLVCACVDGYLGICSVPFCQASLLHAGCFEGLPLSGPNTNLNLIPTCYTYIMVDSEFSTGSWPSDGGLGCTSGDAT